MAAPLGGVDRVVGPGVRGQVDGVHLDDAQPLQGDQHLVRRTLAAHEQQLVHGRDHGRTRSTTTCTAASRRAAAWDLDRATSRFGGGQDLARASSASRGRAPNSPGRSPRHRGGRARRRRGHRLRAWATMRSASARASSTLTATLFS
jgi:hypothetical protein